MRVFISHVGRDQAWAEWVAWQLREAGHATDFDKRDWEAGSDFIQQLNDVLDRCDIIVALVLRPGFVT